MSYPSRDIAYEAARLRVAGSGDIAALTAFFGQARKQSLETEISMQAWLEHGGALVLEHAEANGHIVCALRWREETEGWRVDRIATLPEFRGQSFGRWLMTKVEALAIKRNISWLFLELDEDREDLLAYYGRMGYRRVESNGQVTLRKRVGGTWQKKGSGAGVRGSEKLIPDP